MSRVRKPSLVAVNLIILGLFVVMGFNNCQPMESIDNSVSSSSNGGGAGSGGGGGGGTSLSAGETYFNNTVKPTLMVRCNTCHALPKDVVAPNMPGPLTIFTYTSMKSLMMAGPSSVNNPLFNKVIGSVAHSGGNQCPGDLNGSVTPCRELKQWATTEFPLFTDGVAGAIVNVSPTGLVRGWTLDTKNPTAALTVNIYSGGAIGAGGVLVGSMVANLPGDGIQQNGHYFNFQLPPAYSDGVVRQLYFYGGPANANSLFPAMPRPTVAYTPRAAGQQYFTNTVQPMLQACVGCHGNLDYQTRYAVLISPLPANGGTAANNELVTKMMGGNAHGGGNQCGGANAARCNAVRQWWALEFQ